MPAYVILIREEPLRDPAEYAEYQRKSRLRPPDSKLKPLVVYGRAETIEGDAPPPDGVIVLEFPTVEDARAWHGDPAYQDAAAHRLRSGDYRGFIVEGFAPPPA